MMNITYISIPIPTYTGYDLVHPVLVGLLWIFAIYGFYTFFSQFIRCCEDYQEKMKQLLKFEELQSKGKTKLFGVYSTHSNDYLGLIHWRSGWRCYVISYMDGIDMSLSCNKELNEFMQKLEDKRKE